MTGDTETGGTRPGLEKLQRRVHFKDFATGMYVATIVFAILVGVGAGWIFSDLGGIRLRAEGEFNWTAFWFAMLAGLTPIPFIAAASLVVRAWVDVHRSGPPTDSTAG